MRRWFLVLSIVVILGGIFLVPRTALAGCCTSATYCFDATQPNDCLAGSSGGTYYIYNSRNCADIGSCQNPTQPAPDYKCCVCNPSGGQDRGTCNPIQYVEQARACNQGECHGDFTACTEIEQCRIWRGEGIDFPDTSTDPVLVKFIPSLTIPGSSIFNKGVPVIVTGKTMGEYIAAIYVFFVGVAGILSTVFIMYGGIRYVISTGNPSQIQGAKETITSALVGLGIAVASYTILLTINPTLVQFDGFKLEHIQPLRSLELATGTEKAGGYVVSTNVNQFDNCITEVAAANGIDRTWLKALMLVESNGNPKAKSNAGAYGLVQLLPSTAQKYKPGVSGTELLNPALNLSIAGQHYRDLLYNTCPDRARYKSGQTVECNPEETKCKDGDHDYANAAYNGGLGANCSSLTCPGQTWWECEQNSGYAETRAYVTKVRTAYENIIASNASSAETKYDWDISTPTCAELATGGN